MAHNYIQLSLIFCVCFHFIFGFSSSPVSLGNPEICSPTGRKGKLGLSRHKPNVTVLETRSFDEWSGHRPFRCQFEVKDSKDHPIFAVIQHLEFRKENGNCIDFVEFKADNGATKSFCGEINAFHLNTTDHSANNIADNSFIDDEGEMRVTIFVDSRKLLPNENLALKIAFTSAQRCHSISWNQEYLPCNNEYCILKSLYNDSIVNCPFKDCRDEGGCAPLPESPPYRRPSVGTKVTIGAITTVLMSFLLFFACIWVLRRYHKMCWANDVNRNQEMRLTPVPPTSIATEQIETHNDSPDPAQASTFLPTAPPTNELKTPIGGDKDLPPSYESLFPRTNYA